MIFYVECVYLIFILFCINQLFQSTGDDLCSSLNCPCNYPIIYFCLGVHWSATVGANLYRASYTMWQKPFRGLKWINCEWGGFVSSVMTGSSKELQHKKPIVRLWRDRRYRGHKPISQGFSKCTVFDRINSKFQFSVFEKNTLFYLFLGLNHC